MLTKRAAIALALTIFGGRRAPAQKGSVEYFGGTMIPAPSTWVINLDQISSFQVNYQGKTVEISAEELFAALQPPSNLGTFTYGTDPNTYPPLPLDLFSRTK